MSYKVAVVAKETIPLDSKKIKLKQQLKHTGIVFVILIIIWIGGNFTILLRK
jgi:hypothetical protein